MILLHVYNITGPQLFAVVERAQGLRGGQLQRHVSKQDFCDAAGMSRQQLYNYSGGAKPSAEAVRNVATALKAWGIPAKLITD